MIREDEDEANLLLSVARVWTCIVVRVAAVCRRRTWSEHRRSYSDTPARDASASTHINDVTPPRTPETPPPWIEDQGQTDRPRYHVHVRWTPPLPLVMVAPRRTPRRATAGLLTL